MKSETEATQSMSILNSKYAESGTTTQFKLAISISDARIIETTRFDHRTFSTQQLHRHINIMDFQDAGEEFSIDDVETVIKSAIGSVLADTEYKPNKVNDW